MHNKDLFFSTDCFTIRYHFDRFSRQILLENLENISCKSNSNDLSCSNQYYLFYLFLSSKKHNAHDHCFLFLEKHL